jgi:hypothetical protein
MKPEITTRSRLTTKYPHVLHSYAATRTTTT